MTLISVVMPVFNRTERFSVAARSVLDQVDAPFELIVVDDGSTEPALRLYEEIEALGHRVVFHSTNRGPGAARNTGAALARGEWLTFLDSDDVWLPEKLIRSLESLQRSGLKVGQTDEIWYRHGHRVNPPKAHRISGGDLFGRSLKAVCVSSSTVLLKTELFNEIGGFDESLFVCEDYDLWLQVAVREEFDHHREPLVLKYGGHDDQLSKALPAMDRFRIFSILKGLVAGSWGSRDDLAIKELERKLRILSKGSAKRGRENAVQLCAQISDLLQDKEYRQALTQAALLIEEWPLRPT